MRFKSVAYFSQIIPKSKPMGHTASADMRELTTATATRTSQICIFSGKKAIALHALRVRFLVLSISLPSSAKQQRKIAKFEVLRRASALEDKFSCSPRN